MNELAWCPFCQLFLITGVTTESLVVIQSILPFHRQSSHFTLSVCFVVAMAYLFAHRSLN